MKAPTICLAAALATCSVQSLGQDKFQPSVEPMAARKLEQARKLRVSGELDTSIKQLKDLVTQNPDYYAANYNLGLALTEANRQAEGIAFLEKARSIGESDGIKDATIYNSLGWAYMVDGRYREAEGAFMQGERDSKLLSNESKARLYNNWGWLYLNTGQPELAKQKFQVAAEQFGSGYAAKNVKDIQQRVPSVAKDNKAK